MSSDHLGNPIHRFTAGTERAQSIVPSKRNKFLVSNGNDRLTFNDLNRSSRNGKMHTTERKQASQQRIFSPIAASRLDGRRTKLCALSVPGVLFDTVRKGIGL
jgi:hypothetical protein